MKPQLTIATMLLAGAMLAAESLADVNVTVRLVDQNNTEIPGSVIQVPALGISAPTGSVLTLPEATHTFRLVPGVFGFANVSVLRRDEFFEVTGATTEVAFEWITVDGPARVHDQSNVDIPASLLRFTAYGENVSTGGAVTLPITDNGVYPTIAGTQAGGYGIFVTPGVFGFANVSVLRRDEFFEVTGATTEVAFEWIQFECALEVVDATDFIVPGSTLVLPTLGAISAGTVVPLPITDETVYSTIAGTFANGYPITVIPGDIAPTSDTFAFELLASGEFDPASFVIDGNTYGLVCAVSEPVDLLLDLIGSVMALNLQQGINNSLDAKLDAALGALEDMNANNNVAAINALQAFINAVQAQSGVHIPVADADALIAQVQQIIDLLNAP